MVIADTGPLYALIDRSDAWHERVTAWWRAQARQVRVPITVVPEVCYLLQTRISAQAEQAFVRSVADGELIIEPLKADDVMRVQGVSAFKGSESLNWGSPDKVDTDLPE